MNSFTLQAPAKLNLSLRILGKRDDGFHEIDTLMVKIPSLTDEIEFQEAEKFSFVCDDSSVPSDERNLVVKAVRAYESAAKVECKWAISLKKRIPHGAGLGGGSSDAAATLLGMNRIYDSKLSEESLGTLAASLGSDVSFFLMDGPARCVGRGEKILPAPPISPLRVLLFKPCFEVATPDAYQRWESSLEIPGISYAPQNFAGITLINDLERAVFGKHRFLAELKHWLLARGKITAALMSGSGSTVFAVLEENADATSLTHSAHLELDPELWAWSGTIG
jgi:4-diphosphocytidyl-2-C-methyl-D-erythritol kinase